MSNDSSKTAPELSRQIGLVLLTLYGLGVTVGAGIYVLIGELAGRSGHFAPYAFLAAAVVILPTAISFSILVSKFPVSSGEARYTQEAFARPWLTSLVGMLVAAVGIVSAATVSVGSAGYIRALWEIPAPLIIVTVVCVFGLLVFRGIKESVMAAAIMTVVEIGGLLIIIAFGFSSGVLDSPPKIVETSSTDISLMLAIASGTILAFYAFVGFEDMVNIAEEVKSPSRIFPISITIVLLVTTVLYFLITSISVNAIPPEMLQESESPLTDVAFAVGFGQTNVISLIGAIAALNGILIQLIMASRVIYGLARLGRLPQWLATVDATTSTPRNAIAIVTLLVLALAITNTVGALAVLTSTITLTVFIIVNAALIKLWLDRRIELFPLLGLIPFAGVIFSAALLGSQLVSYF